MQIERKDTENFDEEFYQMCIEDNLIIFEFTSNQQEKIPKMSMDDLNKIVFSKLKLNKACDIYKLTVEHIRNAGPVAAPLVIS